MRTSFLTLILLLLLSTADSFAGVLRVGTWSSSGTPPHPTLTSALTAAAAGDEVWVVQGLYQESEFIIPSGVSVYGGFTGSETHLSERNYATSVTILDGSGAHRVATVSGLLDGFTLRNGRTGDNGGGVIVKSGGTLSHCTAFANEAGYDGGGVYAEDGGTVSNTLLTGNRAGNDGVALSGVPGFRAVSLTAVDNTFTDKPEIKKTLSAPAGLTAGQVLNVAEPDILNPDEVDSHGSTILMKGWELDGHAIPMPYTVSYADNGKKLRFWAANAVGVGVSNEVSVTVTWTVTSSVQLLTPKAVCEGTTLAAAGMSDPAFSPAPDGGATYTYSIDGSAISGLDYALQYSDNGKLLTCKVKNADGSIVGATTAAVRLAVMKAPDVLLSPVAALRIEEGQPLCLPAPVIISNGSDVTAQGWKWRIGAGTESTFNSCDKSTTAMNGATIYYTAENGCSAGVPSSRNYTTLTVTNPVGEFLQTVSALCSNMPLHEGISFNDGGNSGDYYIGNTYIGKAGEEGNFTTPWDDVKTTVLTTAHNLQVLRFSYNGGKSERRMTLTVHPVPVITVVPVTPAGALCLGDAHTLTVEATGDNLSYQWERSVNSTDGADGDWANIPGSTTAACRLTAEVPAYYRCAVTGVCIDKSAGVAGGKITSASAQLTVNDRPVIPDVAFTAADLKICAGSEISTILAGKAPTLTGTPALGQGWTLGGVKIAADYEVLSMDNGKVLGYWASNACGERTATFPTGILPVTSRPELLQSPADVQTVEDSRVRLSVSASGSDLTYQWQQKANADADIAANWHEIDATAEPSAATPAYSFTATNITTGTFDGSDVLTDYRCIVGTTNACNATTVTSAPATVTVTRSKAAVSLRRQPASYEVCNSEPAPYAPGFTVEIEGSGHFVYSWYGINDRVNPVEQTPGSGNLADAVAAKTNTFKPSAAGTYYCVITSTDDAVGVQTQAVSLTVSQAPVINSITPAAATICEGGSVTLGVDAVGSGLTYQWFQQLTATQTPATDTKKGTAPTFTPVGLATTATFYCIVGSGSVCTQTVASASVVVTVQRAPKITVQPVSQSVCGGAGISLTVTATDADSYQWYYNGGLTGGNSATLPGVVSGGVYTCVVSMADGVCGEVTSVPALITVANAPKVNLGTRTGLTACPGDFVTLPSPEVETGGSVIVPEKTGWYLSTEADPATATLVASFPAGNADVIYHYKLTYKCSEGGTETVLSTMQGMPVLTVTVTAPASQATFTTDSSLPTTCEGDEVTLPAVARGSGYTDGYWTLNDQTKGDITKYVVHSADDKAVFRYVNVNRCGVKTTSADTYTLNVKQPARITSLLSSPVIFEAGAALNTKITTPADNYGTVKKWTLNGTEVTLTKATALTDNAGRLVYSVDNGCTTGIGSGGVDETSATLLVWSVPTVGGTSTTTTKIYGKEGSFFGLPAIPAVTANNCTIGSAGWKYDKFSNKEVSMHGTKAGLTRLAEANFTTHNGNYVYYEVEYNIPGNDTAYYVRKAFGQLVPWKEPTIPAQAPSVGNWDYVCDNKTFAAMSKTFTTVNCTATFNCTLAAVTWETQDGRVVTTGSKPALTDNDKNLYCVQTWTAPDGSATGKVKSKVATMKVNNVPVITAEAGTPGTDKIVVTGTRLQDCMVTTVSDALRRTTVATFNKGTLGLSDHNTYGEATATNLCGSARAKLLIDLSLKPKAYYAGRDETPFKVWVGGRESWAIRGKTNCLYWLVPSNDAWVGRVNWNNYLNAPYYALRFANLTGQLILLNIENDNVKFYGGDMSWPAPFRTADEIATFIRPGADEGAWEHDNLKGQRIDQHLTRFGWAMSSE